MADFQLNSILETRERVGVDKMIGSNQRYAFVRIKKSNVNFCFWLVKDK
jgi:hypothetical protein